MDQKKKHRKAKVIGCYVDDESFHDMEVDGETFSCHARLMRNMMKRWKIDQKRSEHIDVPDYIQANAQRGLDNLDKAGDGLVEQTVTEARALAEGSITEDKLRSASRLG